jgi:hypothetical protein
VSEREPPDERRPEERIDLTGLSRLSDRPPPPKGEGAIRAARGVSVLLLAIAAAGLPWYFVTRGSGKPEPRPSPTPTRTTASPSPSPSGSPGTFEVYGVANCLRIRPQPTTAAAQIDCVQSGFQLTSDGKTQVSEGRLWRHVYDKLVKKWGWAADQYLKQVGSG